VANKAEKPTVTHGDVFDAIFPPEQAAVVKFKADLYEAVLRYAKKYSQKELQIILNEPQPRISELMNGKLGKKSVDKLLQYAGRLGLEPRSTFPQVHKDVPKHELELAAV
jgi:predicted XRE-type DNA-binding protein